MRMRMRMKMSMSLSVVYKSSVFFDNYGVKILLDVVKILEIAFFDTLYFLN